LYSSDAKNLHGTPAAWRLILKQLSARASQVTSFISLALCNINCIWEESVSLFNNRSELYPEVMAVEPFFPQHIGAPIDIVPAHIKGRHTAACACL